MSRICEICGKGRLRGKLVPRGIGRRVTRRTTSHQMPNLRVKRIDIGGRITKVKICTTCLSTLNRCREAAVSE